MQWLRVRSPVIGVFYHLKEGKAELVFSSQDLTLPEEKNDAQNPPTQALPVVVKTPPRVVVAENLALGFLFSAHYEP